MPLLRSGRPRSPSLACGALLLLVAGCGRGELRDWIWRDREVAFRMGPLPPSWKQIRSDGAVEFQHAPTGAVIMAHAECRGTGDEPLGVLRNTLLIGFTDRTIREEERITLDGREALRTRISARLDGVPVELCSYVLKKDNCVYDLVYAAPPDRFAEARPDFQRFVDGFTALGS